MYKFCDGSIIILNDFKIEIKLSSFNVPVNIKFVLSEDNGIFIVVVKKGCNCLACYVPIFRSLILHQNPRLRQEITLGTQTNNVSIIFPCDRAHRDDACDVFPCFR